MTMSSLDSLLGSTDSMSDSYDDDVAPSSSQARVEQEATARQKRRNVLLELTEWRKGRMVLDASDDKAGEHPPKVKPLSSYVLYYYHIGIFMSIFLADAYDGPGAGDDLLESLANDHLMSTRGGDWLRLFTAPFVHSTPWALFITLLALLTLSAEAEAVMGYWAFGVLAILAPLTAGLADIYFNDYPVTLGSLPFVAALVGAIIAHMLKNAHYEDEVDDARRALLASRGSVAHGGEASPGPVASTSGAHPPGTSSSPSSSSSSDPDQVQQGWDGNGNGKGSGSAVLPTGAGGRLKSPIRGRLKKGGPGEDREREVEVELFEGLWKLNFRVSSSARTMAAAATTLMSAVEALYDLQASGNETVSWAGIAAGLGSGFLLSACLSPKYAVAQEPLAELEGGAAGNGVPGQQVLVVRDASPLALKVVFVAGYCAGLLAVYRWLCHIT